MIDGSSRRRLQEAATQVRKRLETDKSRNQRNRLNEAASEAEQALHAVLRLDSPTPELPELELPRTRTTISQRAHLWLDQHGLAHLRSQLQLLVSTPEHSVHDRHETRLAKQNASLWASRYATHLVILTLLLTIGLFGGFKGLTVQAAGNEGVGHAGTDNYVEGASNPLEASFGRYDASEGKAAAVADLSSRNQVITIAPNRVKVYTIVAGDTIQSLATKFGLDRQTIMGANKLVDPDTALTLGQDLIILPLKGAYHIVDDADSLDRLAVMYQVDPQAIIDYKPNGLNPGEELRTGQALVIPGGTMLPREQVFNYTSRNGDTLASVASKFDLQAQTLLWANPQVGDGSQLAPSTVLLIPAIDGIMHKVVAGDTISSVAGYYGISPDWLANYGPNHLDPTAELEPGTILMVPGANQPTPTPLATPTAAEVASSDVSSNEGGGGGGATEPSATSTAKSRSTAQPSTRNERNTDVSTKKPGSDQPKKRPQPEPTATPKPTSSGRTTGHFIWPADGVITQYYSWRHNGLDIAEPAGSSIVAADGGTVSYASWRSDGLGNCVIIDHDNGYHTIYGHMLRRPSVYVGQRVSRGQFIGYVGSTGHSTGPHVHFMIKIDGVTRNPLRYLR